MMYDKEVLTVYEAKNGYVVKIRDNTPSKNTKGDAPVKPAEDEMHVCQTVAQALKIIKSELTGVGDSDEDSYGSAFKEAAKKK